MFKIIKIKSWEHAQEIGESMIRWGFRGQEDAAWELDTTLHRTARAFNLPFDFLWHREYWMLRQFQRRAHNFCNELPNFDQKIDWLALMQHYGAPTRLLDFTHSFYVAAYFALENSTKDSAIWTVNLDFLTKKIAHHCGVETRKENIDMANQRHIAFVNDHISIDGEKNRQTQEILVHVEPERLHERLLTQQGFFLFPCNIGINFGNILANAININPAEMKKVSELEWDGKNIRTLKISSNSIIKIILPVDIRKKALQSLDKMNITAATLFPGLDGFAKSMKYHLSTFPI